MAKNTCWQNHGSTDWHRSCIITVIGMLIGSAVLFSGIAYALYRLNRVSSFTEPPREAMASAGLTDPDNRAACEELIARSQVWADSFTQAWTGQASTALSSQLGEIQYDTALVPLEEKTRPWREEIFTYLLTHDIALYIDPDIVLERHLTFQEWPVFQPNQGGLMTATALEHFFILQLRREGHTAAAAARLLRQLQLRMRLSQCPMLLNVLFQQINLCRSAHEIVNLYTFTRQDYDPAERDQFCEILTQLEAELTPALDRAINSELIFQDFSMYLITRYQVETPAGFNPVEYYHEVTDSYQQTRALNQRNFWEVKAQCQLQRYGQQQQPQLRNWLSTLLQRLGFSAGQQQPYSNFTTSYLVGRRALAQNTVRLALLQLYLVRYQQEHGQLPATLNDLYTAYQLDPFIDITSGQEFSYPGIIANNRVDLASINRTDYF